MEIMRATEEWQRAGAYSVRIQGMNKQHNISLREEFDEHDCEGTYYIVVLDDGYPIATCRFYEIADHVVSLGRVVVLPEYRKQGLGMRVVAEAEHWMQELGYQEVEIDSRLEAIEFYQRLGYKQLTNEVTLNGVFECVKMKKDI